MKGMLLAMIEGETPKVDEEILKWQMPAHGAATAAGAIPGAEVTKSVSNKKGEKRRRQNSSRFRNQREF